MVANFNVKLSPGDLLSFIISCYGSKYGFQFVHAIYEKLARVYILYIQQLVLQVRDFFRPPSAYFFSWVPCRFVKEKHIYIYIMLINQLLLGCLILYSVCGSPTNSKGLLIIVLTEHAHFRNHVVKVVIHMACVPYFIPRQNFTRSRFCFLCTTLN